jgi:hypothetical protein
MIVFLNLLVQRGKFETIDVNFLIVGHKHSSIDQYFSVLSKAISRAGFIGSPLSLEKVLGNAFISNSNDRKNHAVIRQVVVYNDMVTTY